MSTVLITGGAGYKGVLLTQAMLERRYNVIVLDNFMYGFDSFMHLVSNPRLRVIRKDIRAIDESDVKSVDAVFHLAAISGYPACEANPHSAKLINVDATQKLAKLLSPRQCVIYASTTSFYGRNGACCDEDSYVSPVSMYGVTKYQAEQILMERENSIALRFATLFGVSPKMRIDLLPNDFAYRAMNDRCVVIFESASKRTFLHVRDAIRAYELSLDNFNQMRGGIFNVGHEELNFTKLEIAQAVKDATGCKVIDSDMDDFDVRNFVISFEKFRALGFKPTMSLNEGVKELTRLYEFYRPLETFKTI